MQAQCWKTCLKVFEGKSTFAKNSATPPQLMCLFVRTCTKLLIDRTGLAKNMHPLINLWEYGVLI